MGYKRKVKSNIDLAKSVSKKLNLDFAQCEKVTNTYFDKIKKSLLLGDKVSLNEFGTFEMTKWNSQGIYHIGSGTKIEREIKTILFRPSPVVKKKLAD